MAPKAIEFSPKIVLAAAVEVVRRHGLEGLSARRVADRLKASVAPVYSSFRSMADLERNVLISARRLMDEQTRREFTEIPFLNIGVGIVTFARNEGRLFAALFHSRHHYQDILTRFHQSVLKRMKEDPMLRLLADPALARLLDSIWFYTLGLATAVITSQIPKVTDHDIIRRLKDMGNILIHAEATGIADCESPENEREWARIIKEKS